MKKEIEKHIRSFVAEYQKREDIATVWGEPIVGFADAWHPYIQALRETISPSHVMPQEVLPDCRIIVAYYVPFTRELARTNLRADHLASPEWARTYEETNAMFGDLNQSLIDFLTSKGYHAAISSKAGTFDQVKLISDWSQRHIAYAAGLGTFGMNNMLITKKGCCG
ncbi:MAG: epoxyqueuosine reductase, partial [Firmicutes bacterium]|nr:epoxyqueuosine reductase [Bacillota bacterium]